VRLASIATLLVVFLVGGAAKAGAQGFISPSVGYNFGGDAGCPNATNCDDKRSNIGIAVGSMGAGSPLGIELELAYSKDFFGATAAGSSSILTVMASLMLAPQIGPVAPYFLAGVGLLKTHADLSIAGLLSENDENNIGWDVGRCRTSAYGATCATITHFRIRASSRCRCRGPSWISGASARQWFSSFSRSQDLR
jgi:opacity protein-like surface antigen